ncbi:MAG: mechanosensitive ion channel family protein [Thiotrichales bacterium]|nr:mechanosensitive ion channel family protein [Thiotrichales bacterium]
MEQEIESLQKMVDIASEIAIEYGFQFVAAIIILLIGWQIAKWVAGLVIRLCQKAGLDITLSKFFSGVAKILVLVFVVIIALGKFGITIAPFIAALGAVAFGGTLALQGLLSNFAAGLTIILTRPFVVNDTIKIQGVIGVVEEIKLGYTMLMTEDGEEVLIPNKQIVGEILHNSHENMVVESVINIDYQDKPGTAVDIIHAVLNEHDNVSNDPAPQVGIQDFGDWSIVIGFRYWVQTKMYFQTRYQVNNAIFEKIRAAGINIPSPKRDIRLAPAD